MPKKQAEEEPERATGIAGVIERAEASAEADNIVEFLEFCAAAGAEDLDPVSVAIGVRGYKYYQASKREGASKRPAKKAAKKAPAKKAVGKKTAAKKTGKKTAAAKKTASKKTATKRVGKKAAAATPQPDAEF